jgi:hypothetical protein
MSHLHWVTRQNKLEIPNDKDEVNTREIHKCDGQAHDPDTMVAPVLRVSINPLKTRDKKVRRVSIIFIFMFYNLAYKKRHQVQVPIKKILNLDDFLPW